MTPRQRRWVLAGGGAAVVGFVVMGIVLIWPDKPTPAPAAAGQTANVPTASAPAEVADSFLRAFQSEDARAASALTDDPAAAAAKLAEVWKSLPVTNNLQTKRTKPADPVAGSTTIETAFRVTWPLSPGNWDYTNALTLARVGEQWKVHWTPALVHPKLTADNRIAVVSPAGQQPAVFDRDGAPLLIWEGTGPKPVDATIAPLLVPGMARIAGGGQGGKGGGAHVALQDAAGTELEVLFGSAGAPAKPVTSTLSVPTQKAAQAAVDSVPQGAILVAIQPSSGEILAVAQNTAAGSSPVALNGGYPAGSTFKIATAAAVLEAGAATVDTSLPCPGVANIGQRTIHNDSEFDLGTVSLHSAFANSCNTTFAKLAGDLPADALSKAATQFGLNADFEIPGFTTEAGRVDPAASTTQRVEDSIGQGVVRVSPFGMALMVATVANGRAVTPKLWRDLETTVKAGYQGPPRPIVDSLRSMMREVVTVGTAKTLGARGTVLGKTGTAQFGDAQHSHGWFVAYRGDLAFATLVVSGESSKAALAVSGKFLAAAG
jgi:beta-lactamase class D